ncbi:EpsG family protein [Lonepinella sp. MS14434]|uniref:EpsG family protein n=1 Tax=Lonepinella sp. MS14434 TaxID=3003617 RepID=UPI0036D8E5EA
MAIIVGNRGGTRDTDVYYGVYSNILNYSLFSPTEFYTQTNMEIGFGWYSYFIHFFSDNSPVLLFLVFSLLIFYVTFKVAIKHKLELWIFLLIYLSSMYFLSLQFMIIRQGVSIPLALWAIIMLSENRHLKFLIISFLAIIFHQLAIPALLAGCFFLWIHGVVQKWGIKLTTIKFLYFIVLIFSFLMAKYVLIDLLLNLSSRVELYSNSEYSESVGLFRLPNIRSLLVFLFILVFLNNTLCKNKIFFIFLSIYTVGVGLKFGFADFSILSGRFSVAMTFTEIYLLQPVFKRFGNVGYLFLLLYVIIQAIVTYHFQFPYVMEDYFNPLMKTIPNE